VGGEEDLRGARSGEQMGRRREGNTGSRRGEAEEARAYTSDGGETREAKRPRPVGEGVREAKRLRARKERGRGC
jgi:hypothetical protein